MAAGLAALFPIAQPQSGARKILGNMAIEDGFDVRWAAWIERGRIHDERVRQRFTVFAAVLAIGASIFWAFVGSW